MKFSNVDLPVIDVDTHIIEPADLWTSRLPSHLVDRAPRVQWNDDTKSDMWYFDDEAVIPHLVFAHSGWSEYAPDYPPTWQDADPATYDASARLARMDEWGIEAQVLYPNVALFTGSRIAALHDTELQNAIVRAFNEWQAEWSAAAPTRLLPMASLPFWDLQACLDEIDRATELGFRGIVFSQNPALYGLPRLSSSHWDSVWAVAQERGLPVNFHVGSGPLPADFYEENSEMGRRTVFASKTVPIVMGNVGTIVELIFGGVCHRFPRLQFVSVESGVGYLPFLLETMDWQFQNTGSDREHPEFDLLPSEYFKRQIYGCFWYERASLVKAVEQVGADNFMFETDFPHPTSQTPGPATHAVAPYEYAPAAVQGLPLEDVEKLVYGNAARLYGLSR